MDEAHVDSAMEDAGITHLRGSCLAELSGGQRQLAWIAMALAQDTPLLLLDEPTTFLDLAHQLEILDTLEKLQQQRQRTIVLVLHDINQAARYASHMVALVDGRIAASGTPEEMMTAENLARVFNIEALVMKRNDDVAVPYCIPISKRS